MPFPSQSYSVYIDEIGEGLVEAFKTSLTTPLGLKICEQGDLKHLPAAKDLDTQLPALFVKNRNGESGPLISRASATYHYRVRFARRFNEGENPTRAMNQAASKIIALIASNRFTVHHVIDELHVDKVAVERWDLDNEEEGWMSLPQFRVSVAWVDLVVETEMTPTIFG